jgi:hypothetical protein
MRQKSSNAARGHDKNIDRTRKHDRNDTAENSGIAGKGVVRAA